MRSEYNNLGLRNLATGYIATLRSLAAARAKCEEAAQAVVKLQESIEEQKLELGNQSVLRSWAVLNIPLGDTTILRIEADGDKTRIKSLKSEEVKITHERLCEDAPRKGNP